MWKTKTLYCKCGLKLLDYRKRGLGRWIKVHRTRISKDYTGIFSEELPKEHSIFCPSCATRVATVQNVSGKWVFKLNQGAVGKIKG